MGLKYLDPTAEPGVPAEAYDLRLPEGPACIALLANGFPGSVALLDAFEAEITRAIPGSSVVRFEKPTGLATSMPLAQQVLDEIVSSADALVTAYGH